MSNIHVSSSPHVRDNSSTQSIMRDVCIALLPASGFAVGRFGYYAALIIIVTVLAAVLSEYIWEKLMKKPVTVTDFSAVVTGMILALNMPPEIPLWIPALGSVFAIIVIKQLYGGLGQNWMNPALGARCFLLLSFTSQMNDFSCKEIGFDAMTSASPLVSLKQGEIVYSLKDNFLGLVPGAIGEVSTICLLIGLIYLLIVKVIDLKIPVIMVGTFAIFSLIYTGSFELTLHEVLSGGLIFGACFMANDYVTSPITPLGQIIYAALLGLLVGIFRFPGTSVEGVSYAILIGNMVTPLIEKVTLPKAFGKEGKKK